MPTWAACAAHALEPLEVGGPITPQSNQSRPVKSSTPVREGWVYKAPPTVARFMRSDSFGRLLCGPVGSGKTTGCLVELARRTGQQAPAKDGRRYSRWVIARQTLKDAKSTVLKDARGWFGSMADWRVSDSTLLLDYGDVFSEWIFVPLDDPQDVKRLLSTQLTGAYINECVETDLSLMSDIAGRCGRYPNGEFGACTWKGMFADTNMPIAHSPWAEFIQNPPADWEVFRQPGGRSPVAENLNHLDQTAETIELPEDDPRRVVQGRKYYERLVRLGTPDYIKRYVDAEFGRDLSGVGVFSDTFNMAFHVVESLEPVHGRLLLVGQDFGRNPWSLITQMDHKGRLMILEEVGGKTGLEQHIKTNLIPVLTSERYRGRPVTVVGDPSGAALDSLFEVNAFQLLRSLGLPAEPAPTNDISPRLRAVESFLMRQVDGKGAMLIDGSRCPTLVQAMDGAYKFARKDDASGGWRDKGDENTPEKLHPWSDVSDSLQYVCLVAGSLGAYAYVLGRTMRRMRPRAARPAPSSLAWT